MMKNIVVIHQYHSTSTFQTLVSSIEVFFLLFVTYIFNYYVHDCYFYTYILTTLTVEKITSNEVACGGRGGGGR